jgi:hypothetical protein
MIATLVRIKQSLVLLGLVLALAVTGAVPLLGGHEIEAKKGKQRGEATAAEMRASPRAQQRFENRESRIGFIEGATTVVTSEIEVSGFETPVTDIEVTLFSVYHGGNAGEGTNSSDDMDVLLVGPDGQATLLLSDVGGTTTTSVSQLVFDDQAQQTLPDNSALAAGTYRPTNFDWPDFIPGYGTAPEAASLAIFNGSDPNGTWTLWARDDTVNGIPKPGSGINGGWALTITTANGAPDAAADDFTAKAGKTLRVPGTGVLGNDRDPDAEALTAILAEPPRKGKVELEADGSFTYTAKKKAKGKDSFTYLAQDPGGLSATATVEIQIKSKKHKKGKKR